MLNVGQVMQNTETGKFAIYFGFDNSDLPLGPMIYYTPERVEGGNYSPVVDVEGNIVLGEFAEDAGLDGHFWGLIEPDRLDSSDWETLHRICAQPAQPVRPTPPRPLSVDC